MIVLETISAAQNEARSCRPCEADTRHHTAVVGINESTAISGSRGLGRAIEQNDRRIIRIDRRHLVIDLVDRLDVLIPNTEVESESWRELPIVLDEVSVAPRPHADGPGDTAFADKAGTVQQEIGRGISVRFVSVRIDERSRVGCAGAEVVEAADRAVVAGVEVVLLLAKELNTELEGVPVLQPGEVISVQEGVQSVVGAECWRCRAWCIRCR